MSFVRKPLSSTFKNGNSQGSTNDGKQTKRNNSSSQSLTFANTRVATKPSAPSHPKPSLSKVNPETEILLSKIKLLQINFLKTQKVG
jgi:hypothetical protein